MLFRIVIVAFLVLFQTVNSEAMIKLPRESVNLFGKNKGSKGSKVKKSTGKEKDDDGKIIRLKPEKFTMNKSRHTLFYDKGEIIMASKQGKLRTKLQSARREVTQKPNSRNFQGRADIIVKQIDRLIKVTNSTDAKIDKAVKSGDKTEILEAQRRLDKLGGIIGRFGNEYEFKSFEFTGLEDHEKIRIPRKVITFDMIKNSEDAITAGFPVYDEKHSKEYENQLKIQEQGINKMTVKSWLENKRTFDRFGRQQDNNKIVRTRIRRDLARGFADKMESKLKAKGYSIDKIERMQKKFVDSLMKNTAALHNPDQVAGGKTTIDYEIGTIMDRSGIHLSQIIGNSRANWYIGTQQWPRKEDDEKRAEVLRQHAQEHFDKAQEEEKEKLLMSVLLKIVRR